MKGHHIQQDGRSSATSMKSQIVFPSLLLQAAWSKFVLQHNFPSGQWRCAQFPIDLSLIHSCNIKSATFQLRNTVREQVECGEFSWLASETSGRANRQCFHQITDWRCCMCIICSLLVVWLWSKQSNCKRWISKCKSFHPCANVRHDDDYSFLNFSQARCDDVMRCHLRRLSRAVTFDADFGCRLSLCIGLCVFESI